AQEQSLLGDGRLQWEPLVALGHRFGSAFDLLGNLWLRLRPPRQIIDVQTGNELGVRAGGAWLPGRIVQRVFAELEAETFLRAKFAAGSVPAEWRAGVGFCLARSLSLDAAGGTAIGNGIGAGKGRFIVGMGYSPTHCAAAVRAVEPAPPEVARAPPPLPEPKPAAPVAKAAPPQGRDGDGIPDAEDSCPDQPGPRST